MKPIATLWVLLVAISPVFAGMWRDDFEHEGLDDWKPDTLGRGERAEWNIEQGVLSGRNIDRIPDNWVTSLVTGRIQWTDYDLRVKVRFTEKQAGWAGLGIALRSQEEVITGFYSLAFLLDQGQVAAYKRQGFNVAPFMLKPINAVPDKWYLLQITVDGKHIQFYVDGELLADANDATFASGKVCLWFANVHAYFDDVIVSGPNIPDGGHWEGQAIKPLGKLVICWGSLKRSWLPFHPMP